jgi:hypothetical protein
VRPRGAPCDASRALSWGFVAFQGLGPVEPGRTWVPSDPCGVSTPFGCSFDQTADGRSRSRPLLRFRAPSEVHLGSPAPDDRPVGSAPDASSPELSRPTAQSRGGGPVALRRALPSPPRATSGVWLPPSRLPPPSLPAREAPERPWASPFGAFSSTWQVPLSGAWPSWRCRHRTRTGGARERRRPTSGLRSHGELVLHPAPKGRTVDASLGFSPPERSPHPIGHALSVALPTLSLFDGMTSQPE